MNKPGTKSAAAIAVILGTPILALVWGWNHAEQAIGLLGAALLIVLAVVWRFKDARKPLLWTFATLVLAAVILQTFGRIPSEHPWEPPTRWPTFEAGIQIFAYFAVISTAGLAGSHGLAKSSVVLGRRILAGFTATLTKEAPSEKAKQGHANFCSGALLAGLGIHVLIGLYSIPVDIVRDLIPEVPLWSAVLGVSWIVVCIGTGVVWGALEGRKACLEDG